MGKKFIICLRILLIVSLLTIISACNNSTAKTPSVETNSPQSNSDTNNDTAIPSASNVSKKTDDKTSVQIPDETIETTTNSDVKTDNTSQSESDNEVSDNKSSDQIYKVRVTMASSDTQIGAFKNLENAKKECDNNPGYRVFDNSGKAIYSGALDTLKSNQALLYIMNKQSSGIYTKVVDIKDDSIDSLLQALIDNKVLRENTHAVSFSLDKNNHTASLDISKEFFDLLNYYGVSGEMYTYTALVNTIIVYYNLDNLTLTYNSNSIDTGHCSYDKTTNFCSWINYDDTQ